MSSGSAPSRDLPNPLWDRRWRLAAWALVIVVALGVFVIVVATSFHWPLFWWGALIGIAAAALILGLGLRDTQRDKIRPELRIKARRQLLIYGPLWVLLGVMAGFSAAVADAAWPDLLLLAFLAFQVLSIAVMASSVTIRFRRRNP